MQPIPPANLIPQILFFLLYRQQSLIWAYVTTSACFLKTRLFLLYRLHQPTTASPRIYSRILQLDMPIESFTQA